MSTKIAVAVDNGQICGHFGHCGTFAIYEYGQTTADVTKVLVDSSSLHGHMDMANLMKEREVKAVIVGSMGQSAYDQLIAYGILPVIGYGGDPDTAADMLVSGRLAINGINGGNCGCHHHEEGEGCGCGCGHEEGESCGCGGGCGGCC